MPEQASPPTLDTERQKSAKVYARIHRRLYLVDLGIGGIYLIGWLVSGLNLAVRDWITTLTGGWIVALAVFSAVFMLPYMLIGLPLSFYSGYILPHRYDQSNQTLRSWIGDQIKGLAINVSLGLLLLLVVYWLLRIAPDWWWLYAAGVMLIFSVILANLAPVLIAPLFYKFTPLDDEDLSERLTRLAEQAGTQIKGVFRMDMSTRTKSANAGLTGLGSTRRIVLGDTLLEEFSADEIETVLAHELGHHVHKDLLMGIVFGTILTLLSFWLGHLALRLGVEQFGLASVADPAGLPILSLAAGVLGLITMPLNNAYSRWRERLADQYALETTRNPQAFADAMTRLANQNLADTDPERWVVLLLHSHPPIQERVAAAQAFAAQQQ